MKERIVGIIGMGWVGSSIAMSILHTGVIDQLWINDVKEGLAEGEAMDLSHGSSFYPEARVKAVEIEEMKACDVVVIAAGRGGNPEETRLDLLNDNAAIVRQIAKKLGDFHGVVILVTNPVDVLTQVFYEASSLPPERVLGTGTMLDTARLREIIGRRIHIEPKSIHAQVIGEHGDSEVVLWSSARLNSRRLRDWGLWNPEQETVIEEQVRKAAYEIIKRKGATNHAIGLVTAYLVKWILRDERRVLCVSRYHEHLGVATSLPVVVGIHGADEIIEPEMDESEYAAFKASVDILRKAVDSLR